MQTTPVSYFSEGQRISAVWRTPDHDGPYRAIVQGPGWLGLKDAKLYVRYHEALVEAGFAVLVIDYRGFGDSEGDRGYLSPAWQLQDLVNAVTYLTTPRRRDRRRDRRLRHRRHRKAATPCSSPTPTRASRPPSARSPSPTARTGCTAMRSEYEWLDFQNSLAEDRRPARHHGGGAHRASPRRDHDPDRRAPCHEDQGRRRRPHPHRRAARMRRGHHRLPAHRGGRPSDHAAARDRVSRAMRPRPPTTPRRCTRPRAVRSS